MTKANPQAPEPGGQTNAAEPRAQSALDQSDEELRRLAGARLAEHLDIGVALAARCEHLAELPKGDRLGAIYAAARLMRANAFIAQALANVAQVERRQRSIVERIQPPDPKVAELNARLEKQEGDAEYRLKVYRRMNEHVEASIRARTGDQQERDSVAELIKYELEELAGIRRQRAEPAAS